MYTEVCIHMLINVSLFSSGLSVFLLQGSYPRTSKGRGKIIPSLHTQVGFVEQSYCNHEKHAKGAAAIHSQDQPRLT